MARRPLGILAATALLLASAVWWHWPTDATPPRDDAAAVGDHGNAPATVSTPATTRGSTTAPESLPRTLVQSQPSNGTLTVFVHTFGREPVADVMVQANGRDFARTDRDGQATAPLAAGVHLLTVDAHSLPSHLLAPSCPREMAPPPGFGPERIDLAAGAAARVDLRLLRHASVVGIVVDAQAQPVRGCPVRLQARAGALVSVALDATTGEDGVFTFDRVPPTRYSLLAFAAQASTPTDPNPLPLVVTVPEGAHVQIQPMVAGLRSMVVRGRLIDQQGHALPGLDVVAYPLDAEVAPGEQGFGLGQMLQTGRSGADGTFTLAVPAGRLRVQPHPEGSLLPLGAPNRLRRPASPIEVPPTNGTHDVGDLRLELSQCMRLTITLVDNVAEVRRRRPDREQVRPADLFVVAATDQEDATKWKRLPLDDGVAQFVCEAPAPDLAVIAKRAGFAAAVRIVPVVLGESALRIEYP